MDVLGLGLFYEDLPIGRTFRTIGRTITETDIINFVTCTGMVEVLFTDFEFQDKESDIKGFVADAHKRWGKIDILHNNVGVSISGGDAELLEITEEAFDRCVAINLKSCILACKHVIPIMREQKSGAIVNISSMAVITTYPYVAYKATKAAMIAFTEQLAYQNASYGIRANVILPGLMNTPMAVDTRARHSGKSRAEVAAMRDARVPLRKKMGTAWDVANAALFLASDEANFISGVALPVDGAALVKIG